jgi:hypothetical protein
VSNSCGVALDDNCGLSVRVHAKYVHKTDDKWTADRKRLFCFSCHFPEEKIEGFYGQSIADNTDKASKSSEDRDRRFMEETNG